MALAGFPDLVILLDDEALNHDDVSSTVTTINGWKKSQIVEQVDAAGDVDERWATVGINKVDPIVLAGPYDNTDPGLWNSVQDDTTWETARELSLTFLGGDTQKIDCYIESVEVNPERGKFHQVVVTLQPTGDVT